MTMFSRVVEMPDPIRAVRTMTDGGLVALIDELRDLEQVNEFQARIFALAMSEAVLRWKGGLLSLLDEDESEPVAPKGVFQKP